MGNNAQKLWVFPTRKKECVCGQYICIVIEESASLSTVGIVQGGQRDEQGVISQDESQLNINASEASEN
ncbi:hypothetical protein SERLA73DRAFT_139552 [Serpula lacrymans var. lacrymans S7.3]|uniref:Uncharacterized protein n=1 Tax=Serpula lacrymans var. lacrymans (strain S7.3) TaxID=936435 RepID=F8Q2F9_SERL3|nr:hypothetical protein SERLA73DRAFT_139552 [Serpula lacrymans var. lacrymans S7.3]